MRFYRSRFYSALELFNSYQYPEPFHVAAKNYFRLHKKFGSKDRKAISQLCYNYLRTGQMFKELSIKEGLLLSSLYLEWEDLSFWNKLSAELGYEHTVDESTYKNYLEEIGFYPTFYPEEMVMTDFKQYLSPANVSFRPKNWAKDHTDDNSRYLGLQGCKEITHNEVLDETIQVQDLSSQYICSKFDIQHEDKVWDVCSGAGGKSLNLSNHSSAKFYLTDIRPQILNNAKKRFVAVHYDASFATLDLTKPVENIDFGSEIVDGPYFDVIIADVPCSGSGTWYRTPEHFMRFDYSSLASYTDRQKSIVKNALPFLKPDGIFYYLTCSVFEAENSSVKMWIEKELGLTLVQEIAFDGIEHRSDAMYMAAFKRS